MRRSDIDELEFLLDDDPAEAVRLARKIVAEIPADADAWGWLAEAHLAARDHEECLKATAEYVRRDPDWVPIYAMRCDVFAALGRFDAAAVEVEVGRAIDSGSPALLRSEAGLLSLKGEFDAADALYARAAQEDPEVPAPPRFDRQAVKAAVDRILREVVTKGLRLKAVIKEVPESGNARKVMTRELELADAKTLVVYVRNIEASMAAGDEIADFEEFFTDLLAELVDAN